MVEILTEYDNNDLVARCTSEIFEDDTIIVNVGEDSYATHSAEPLPQRSRTRREL